MAARTSTTRPASGGGSDAEPAVTIRPLTATDRDAWIVMRVALYVDEVGDGDAGLADEIGMMLASNDWAAFAAEAADGRLVGFIELFERNYAEGCETSPVPFIEGLWVARDWRRQGIARRLVEAGISWARSRGRTEMASDVQLANLASQAMHDRLGFEETERLVTYRIDVSRSH